MRKITTAIFLILYCVQNVYAGYAQSCPKDNASCSDTAGCFWENDDIGCTLCPNGTYDGSSDTDYNECYECTKWSDHIQLIVKNFTKDTSWGYLPFTGAQDVADCAVWIKCPKSTGLLYYNNEIKCDTCAQLVQSENEYEKKDNYFNSSEYTHNIETWEGLDYDVPINYAGCHACPDNSEVNTSHTSCTCNAGYHNDNSEGQTDADKNADTSITNPNHKCILNAYPVTVYNDCDVESPTVASPTDKCKGTVAYKNQLSVAISSCSPQKTGYHRKDNNLNLYKKQGTNDEISTTEEINAIEPGTTYELCPIWVANKFKIKYQAGQYPNNESAAFANNSLITTECAYNEDCNIPSDTPIAVNSAYVFIGWKITKVEYGQLTKRYDTDTLYKKGTNFINATEDNGAIITLTAQWQECPAGYYGCEIMDDGQLYACKCPAGSTSNPGATDIKGCFITSATQFCTGDNCFTLNISNTNRTAGSNCTDKVNVPDTTN